MRRAIPLLLALVVGCGGLGSDEGRGEIAKRDVLLITIDTLRADATGFSGAGRVETPVIDRLADGGRVMSDAHAHAVVTLPSHASLLTGLYPYQHGIRDNAGFQLPADVTTLAERLRGHGYATAAFVSAFPLDRRFGLDAGFEVYDDQYEGYGAGPFTMPERPGSETVARARTWWKEHGDSPRFMWVHLFEPHFPYEPGPPFDELYRERPYFGDVAMADAQLRPLLDPLIDAADGSTIVVLTSDHGEGLGDHGEATHGLFAYESTLKIPLVFWAPGQIDPGTDRAAVRHIDVVPSILDLLDLSVPRDLPGRSLFGGSTEGPDTACYFEALTAYLNRGWAPLQGRIVTGKKAIRLPLPELYDLENDPAEADNLIGVRVDDHRRIVAGIPEDAAPPTEREAVDDETLARLRSLGYVASGASSAPAVIDDPALDPKNLVHVERLLHAALTAYNRGEAAQAVRALREVLEEQPHMSVAYGHLSFIYGELGRVREAVDLLIGARQIGVDTESIRRKLALHLLRLGDAQEAANVLTRDSDSPDPETQAALGRIAATLGQGDEARRRFRRCLELDPTFPDAWIDLGTLSLAEGRLTDAESQLRRGLSSEPGHAEGWNALGAVGLKQGDPVAAIEAWRRALEINPRLADALFNLALTLANTGQATEAERMLERYVVLVDGEERARATSMLDALRRAGTDG